MKIKDFNFYVNNWEHYKKKEVLSSLVSLRYCRIFRQSDLDTND